MISRGKIYNAYLPSNDSFPFSLSTTGYCMSESYMELSPTMETYVELQVNVNQYAGAFFDHLYIHPSTSPQSACRG